MLDTLLTRLDACADAREWARGKTLAEAWNTCPRADWMLWLAASIGVDRKMIVRAACACARTVLHLVPASDDRPHLAINTAEAWTRGEATLEQVREAASAVSAVSAAAYVAAAYAVSAAAYAYAAYVAAAYYADAAHAAHAASDAASVAGTTVDLPAIVRKHITAAMIEEAANAA